MPGSGQWIETSTATTPPEILGDWMQDKSTYTLVFWSKRLAKQCRLRGPLSEEEANLLSKLVKKPDLAQVQERARARA